MNLYTKWDRRFLGLAEHIAAWSKDPSTQVGCVLVDPGHRILSLGFNGLPAGVSDTDVRLKDRETKLRLTLHAEHNAMLFAQGSLAGATCYTWPLPPCAHCAAALIQAGIARVVAPGADEERRRRWGRDLDLSAEILREAGVDLVVAEPPFTVTSYKFVVGD